jgi:hypothetical protein
VIDVFEILLNVIIGTNGDSKEYKSYFKNRPFGSIGFFQLIVISPFDSSLSHTLVGKSIPHLLFPFCE